MDTFCNPSTANYDYLMITLKGSWTTEITGILRINKDNESRYGVSNNCLPQNGDLVMELNYVAFNTPCFGLLGASGTYQILKVVGIKL